MGDQNENGAVIESAQLAGSSPGQEVTWQVDIPSYGCYTFHLIDSYGDGLNGCQWTGDNCTICGKAAVWSYNGTEQISTIVNFEGAANDSEVAYNELIRSFEVNSTSTDIDELVWKNPRGVPQLQPAKHKWCTPSDSRVTSRSKSPMHWDSAWNFVSSAACPRANTAPRSISAASLQACTMWFSAQTIACPRCASRSNKSSSALRPTRARLEFEGALFLSFTRNDRRILQTSFPKQGQ